MTDSSRIITTEFKIGFHNKGMLLAGGCGDTNGRPQIDRTDHLAEGYEFGKNIYR